MLFRSYISQTEKNELFKFVGCRYFNFIKVVMPNFDKIDPTRTQWYLHYWQINEELIKKYYHQITHYHVAPVYIRWVCSELGYGLFANRDIAKDEFLGVCTGEVRSMFDENRNLVGEFTYIWEFPIQAPDGIRFCMDGKFMGNEMRFINHTYECPNATAIDVLINGFIYKCYVANQDIAKDSEIVSYYGDGPWDNNVTDE